MNMCSLLISAPEAFKKCTKNHKLWQEHICPIYMCAVKFVRVAHNSFKQITFSQIHFMTDLGSKGNLQKV